MKKLILFFFVSVSFYCFGQQIIVDYDLLNSSDSILIQPYISCKGADCELIANQAKEKLYLLGYLNASVIEFYKDGKKIYQIHSGNQYKVIKLQFKDVPDSIISEYLEFLQPGAPYSQIKLTEFYNDVLKYYLNTGYPFARVGMESFEFIGTGIVGFIAVNKGPLTVFSKILDASGYYKSNWLMKQAGIQ
ncbi:MAG: hypothetical protein OEW75_08730, partial [Cyclobacteriaceae bacterium]|nr:hypothetical protein [Cyclobacteriaceae bacterium]